MQRVEKEVCGRTLSFEHGQVARQADGGLLARYGDTVILASAVYAKEPPKDYLDYFPLIVDYRVLAYAAGKIPGGFFKREGRPTERETLTSRLIDRPIRPLFPDGFANEVQVVATVVSLGPPDPITSPPVPALFDPFSTTAPVPAELITV